MSSHQRALRIDLNCFCDWEWQAGSTLLETLSAGAFDPGFFAEVDYARLLGLISNTLPWNAVWLSAFACRTSSNEGRTIWKSLVFSKGMNHNISKSGVHTLPPNEPQHRTSRAPFQWLCAMSPSRWRNCMGEGDWTVQGEQNRTMSLTPPTWVLRPFRTRTCQSGHWSTSLCCLAVSSQDFRSIVQLCLEGPGTRMQDCLYANQVCYH